MRISIICKYCGKTWESNYNSNNIERCSVCGDTNLSVKDISKKINYYEGDVPFPEEPTKDLDIDHFFGSEFRGD